MYARLEYCYDNFVSAMKLLMSSDERRAYLIRLLPYLSASILLFLAGTLAGLLIIHRVPDLSDRIVEQLAAFVQRFHGMPPWQLAIAIFLNNAFKTLIAVALGALLGIVPVVFLLANGAALGVAFSLSVQSRGLWVSLASIAPHGVIELPAAFLGTSIGLLIGARAIKRLLGRGEGAIGAELGLGVRYFCAVIAPMLLLAALIEAFVTAPLVSSR